MFINYVYSVKMNINNSINNFIKSKYTQRELLADKKAEVMRIKGILENLHGIISELSENDIQAILAFKKHLNIEQSKFAEHFRPAMLPQEIQQPQIQQNQYQNIQEPDSFQGYQGSQWNQEYQNWYQSQKGPQGPQSQQRQGQQGYQGYQGYQGQQGQQGQQNSTKLGGRFGPELFEQVPPKEDIYYFKPSPTFQGHREGWIFKTGEYGIGYYLDV